MLLKTIHAHCPHVRIMFIDRTPEHIAEAVQSIMHRFKGCVICSQECDQRLYNFTHIFECGIEEKLSEDCEWSHSMDWNLDCQGVTVWLRS